MKLGALLNGLESRSALPPDSRDREVSDVAHDSRKVKTGSLFVAVRGFNADGHRFIPQAVEQGAVAVIAEENTGREGTLGVPLITVPDSRKALARLADIFYSHPSGKVKLVGITGTKGKTTTSYLVKSVIEAAGHRTGLIGTIAYRVGDKTYPAPNTTPESLELQQLLNEMVNDGAEYCVMEVSSHALALGRTDGCVFETAIFTNLGHDHLDFHKDQASYLQSKLLLFSGLGSDKTGVINADDSVAVAIPTATKAGILTFGFTERADIRPVDKIGHGIKGLSFKVKTPRGLVEVSSPLVGNHNVYNILAAIGAGLSLGFPPGTISQGIGAMTAVPGRMEKVDEGQPFGVIVDYAHTEESLERLLESVREIKGKRTITVFGCGGDRDRTKRPKMGAAALRGSDVVLVTSDNPRTEDPLCIIREVESGMSQGVKIPAIEERPQAAHGKTVYSVIPDRRDAIARAIRIAEPGDVVVLAGKGHEDYQIIGNEKVHFDDREVAREEIRRRMLRQDGNSSPGLSPRWERD
jgi:UDP-N-acetylmuramoyl-L-alanyl-D-glutamate--2,6-diaminopimelate ligase